MVTPYPPTPRDRWRRSPYPLPPYPLSDLRRSPTISDDLDEEARERLLGAIAFDRSANAARSERPPRTRQA